MRQAIGIRPDWAEAQRLLKALLEVETFNPAVNLYYGLVCGDVREKEHRFRLVRAIAPDLRDVWGQYSDFHLADALYAQHKYDEAETAYRRLLRRDPEDSATYYNFGGMLDRLGRWQEAEALYRQAASRFRDDHHCHVVLGHLYLRQGRRDEAREQFKLALQKARQQLADFPGCIDDKIIADLEAALREAGGDPVAMLKPKPGR